MGGIHPRSKIYVGKRLAKACANTVYGGKASFTGPTLAGCQLGSTSQNLHILAERHATLILLVPHRYIPDGRFRHHDAAR